MKPVVTPSRIPRNRSPDSDSSGSDRNVQLAPVGNVLSRKKMTDRSLPKKIQSIPMKEDGIYVFIISIRHVVMVTIRYTSVPY